MGLSLSGRKALVTGGTRGIGLAIAERFMADGAAVTITGVKSNHTAPPGCDYLAVDFSDRDATLQFAKEVSKSDFDILVNNAGTNKIAPFAQIRIEDFDLIQDVNLRAPFLLCQAVLLNMRKRGWGRIVNVSSIWGKISKAQRAAYSASKFALQGMTTALAAEVAVEGILANCVSPGFTDTDLTRRILGPEGMVALAASVPIQRLCQPNEIASLVAWLAGPENTYVSGQSIVIDGGFVSCPSR